MCFLAKQSSFYVWHHSLKIKSEFKSYWKVFKHCRCMQQRSYSSGTMQDITRDHQVKENISIQLNRLPPIQSLLYFLESAVNSSFIKCSLLFSFPTVKSWSFRAKWVDVFICKSTQNQNMQQLVLIIKSTGAIHCKTGYFLCYQIVIAWELSEPIYSSLKKVSRYPLD